MTFVRAGVEFKECKFRPAFPDPSGKMKMVRRHKIDGCAFRVRVGDKEFELVAHHPIVIAREACQSINGNWCVSERKSGVSLLNREYDSLEEIAKDHEIIDICTRIRNSQS